MHLSSGLLIRGFGVRVPGGAPGLTWGYSYPRSLFLILCGDALRPSWGHHSHAGIEYVSVCASSGWHRRSLPAGLDLLARRAASLFS
jgi:hypothetical protein